jgi:hypothetical protein
VSVSGSSEIAEEEACVVVRSFDYGKKEGHTAVRVPGVVSNWPPPTTSTMGSRQMKEKRKERRKEENSYFYGHNSNRYWKKNHFLQCISIFFCNRKLLDFL